VAAPGDGAAEGGECQDVPHEVVERAVGPVAGEQTPDLTVENRLAVELEKAVRVWWQVEEDGGGGE
jgi:hypothetical protein